MTPILTLPKVEETYTMYTVTLREGYEGILIQNDNVIAKNLYSFIHMKRTTPLMTYNLRQ